MANHHLKYWNYPGFKKDISSTFQLDLGQGNTPLEQQQKLLPPDLSASCNLWLKREDLNPNGSFKDRALAYQISYLQEKKEKYCVLSSSGNAAISCCAFCQKTNIKPIILISPSISQEKLQTIIKNKPFLLIQSIQARRLAKYIHAKYKIPLLNPSSDPKAAFGFETLGWEIHQQNPNCQAIFSYSTSGASIIGIIGYYLKNKLKPPQIFAVQTSENDLQSTTLTKFYSHLQAKKIIATIKQTSGNLFHVPPDKTQKYLQLLQQNNINSSPEGAACLSAAIENINNPINHLSNIIVIISGTQRSINNITNLDQIHSINNRTDLDQIIQKYLQ